MRIVSARRTFTELPEDLVRTERLSSAWFTGKENSGNHVVCAIAFWHGHLAFIVDCEHPYSFPALLCDITDPRVSRYFVFRQELQRTSSTEMRVHYVWGFPEYVNDATLYARAVDREPEAVGIFKRYKRLFEFEFPDPAVEEKGILLQDRWVQCPKCWDAWEEATGLGMAQCPVCKSIVHNPLYTDVLTVSGESFRWLDAV